ncbi:MAG: hypothetical protein ACTS77_03280 [Arsenophonus sp. NC-TX2-MAG3]
MVIGNDGYKLVIFVIASQLVANVSFKKQVTVKEWATTVVYWDNVLAVCDMVII